MIPPRSFKLLVVDDDEDDRYLISDALSESGIDNVELLFAENGEDALEVITQGHGIGGAAQIDQDQLPHLVLLDWNMPLMGGAEVLKLLRASAVLNKLPVVVLTTSSQKRDVEMTYELGARSFITKPNSFGSLVDVMKLLKLYWSDTVTLP